MILSIKIDIGLQLYTVPFRSTPISARMVLFSAGLEIVSQEKQKF